MTPAGPIASSAPGSDLTFPLADPGPTPGTAIRRWTAT
jgi:hypothetical protein